MYNTLYFSTPSTDLCLGTSNAGCCCESGEKVKQNRLKPLETKCLSRLAQSPDEGRHLSLQCL